MRRVLLLTLLVVFTARTGRAQVTPAAGFTPPDDTPSVRVGIVVLARVVARTRGDQNAKQLHPKAPQKPFESLTGTFLRHAQPWAWACTPHRFTQPSTQATAVGL